MGRNLSPSRMASGRNWIESLSICVLDQLKSIMLLPRWAVDFSSGTIRSSSTSVYRPLSSWISTRSRWGRAASLILAWAAAGGSSPAATANKTACLNLMIGILSIAACLTPRNYSS